MLRLCTNSLHTLFCALNGFLFFPVLPFRPHNGVHAFIDDEVAGDIVQAFSLREHIVDRAQTQGKSAIHIYNMVPPHGWDEQGFSVRQDGFIADGIFEGRVFFIIRVKRIYAALYGKGVLVQQCILALIEEYDVFARPEMGVKHVGAVDVVMHAGYRAGAAEEHEGVVVDPSVADGRLSDIAGKFFGVIKDIPQEDPVFRRAFLDEVEVIAELHGHTAFHVVWPWLVEVGADDGYIQMAVFCFKEFKGPFACGGPVFGQICKNDRFAGFKIIFDELLTAETRAALDRK
jgi:hypothetical protein